jgi:hypothetical protein
MYFLQNTIIMTQMISEVDDNMSGSIDFGEFLKVVERQKEK